MTRAQFFLVAIGAAAAAYALQSPARTLVGTFEGFVDGGPNLRVRGDDGDAQTVEADASTEVRKVAPGERNLQNAQSLALSELKSGDRLLISYAPSSTMARRIVVMPGAAIASRNEEQQREWTRRGVIGTAMSVKSGEILIQQRSLAADRQLTVVLSPATKVRQYRSGSNSYAESVVSAADRITKGDQVRARGTKSEDGSRIEAEEVVFGTFVTKAGTLVSADAAAGTLLVRDLDTDRPLTVRLTPASQVKRFPEFPANPAVMGGAASTPGLRPSMPGSGGPPDISSMIERLPAFDAASIKPGDTIVFSASPTPEKDQLLGVVLLSNARGLVQMAQMRNSRRSDQPQSAMGMSPMGGAGGLDLSGFLP